MSAMRTDSTKALGARSGEAGWRTVSRRPLAKAAPGHPDAIAGALLLAFEIYVLASGCSGHTSPRRRPGPIRSPPPH